ncbi:hypothetical protein FCV25MIE_34353 [Fagus crenata]
MDDLSLVTFEYIGGTPMWEGIERVTHYWSYRVTEVNLVDLNSPSEEIEWGSSFLPIPPSRPAVMTPSALTSLWDLVTSSHFTRILDLEQELEEVRDELDVERASKRESKPHYIVQTLQRQVARYETERERT